MIMMKRAAKAIAGIIFLSLLLAVYTPIAMAGTDAQNYNELPVICIESENTDDLEDYEEAVISVENTSTIFRLDQEKIEWRARTGANMYAARSSYALRFPERVNLMGLGEAKKWMLKTAAADDSIVRDKLMCDLAGRIGLRFPLDSMFIELYINDNYQGIYLLSEIPELNKERVDINPAREEFLLKYIQDTEDSNDPVVETPQFGYQFALESVDYLPADQEEWLIDFFDQAEKALQSGDENIISNYYDVDSLTSACCLDILSRSNAFQQGSTRFVIVREKLYAGPAWDFTLSCGNKCYLSEAAFLTDEPLITQIEGWDRSRAWYSELIKLEWFKIATAEKYVEIQPYIESLYTNHETAVNEIERLLSAMPEAVSSHCQLTGIGNERQVSADSGLKDWLENRNKWVLSQMENGLFFEYPSDGSF